MNKISVQDLVSVISKKHGITQKDAMTFVSVLFDVVSTGLETDRQVKIKGLGTFKVIDVRDRESVNVNTGERIVIDGRSKITFTPDAIMRDLVNRPFAQFETVVINDGVDIGEFEKVDKQVEALHNASSPLTDEAGAEGSKTLPDEEKQPYGTSEDIGMQSFDATQEMEIQTVAGEDTVSGEENLFVEEPADAADDAPHDITEENKDIQEECDFVAEPVRGSDEDAETPGTEQIEEEAPKDIETSHGNVLKKVLLPVLLFLLIAGAASYMGFYFGRKSATDNVASVKVAEKKAGNVETKNVAVPQGALKADSARMKHAADTVPYRKDNTASNASETVKKPAEETVRPKKQEDNNKESFSDKYDRANVMVRTGAYRIVGVERTMVLGKGQTLSSVSKAILGPGMECYIQALNGVKEASEGQTLKIPKLELRRKKKK